MSFTDSLLQYQAFDERDIDNKHLCLEHFNLHNKKSFDRKFYNNGHFTASGFIFNAEKTHILLTHHKFLNAWFQLGGHIDDCDKSVLDGALRECIEESSIDEIKILSDKIFDIDIHVIPENKSKNEDKHYHYDIRYLFITQNNSFKISDESHDLKWISIKDLYDFSPSLRNIIIKINNYLL